MPFFSIFLRSNPVQNEIKIAADKFRKAQQESIKTASTLLKMQEDINAILIELKSKIRLTEEGYLILLSYTFAMPDIKAPITLRELFSNDVSLPDSLKKRFNEKLLINFNQVLINVIAEMEHIPNRFIKPEINKSDKLEKLIDDFRKISSARTKNKYDAEIAILHEKMEGFVALTIDYSKQEAVLDSRLMEFKRREARLSLAEQKALLEKIIFDKTLFLQAQEARLNHQEAELEKHKKSLQELIKIAGVSDSEEAKQLSENVHLAERMLHKIVEQQRLNSLELQQTFMAKAEELETRIASLQLDQGRANDRFEDLFAEIRRELAGLGKTARKPVIVELVKSKLSSINREMEQLRTEALNKIVIKRLLIRQKQMQALLLESGLGTITKKNVDDMLSLSQQLNARENNLTNLLQKIDALETMPILIANLVKKVDSHHVTIEKLEKINGIELLEDMVPAFEAMKVSGLLDITRSQAERAHAGAGSRDELFEVNTEEVYEEKSFAEIPLMMAVFRGKVSAIQKELRKGVSINTCSLKDGFFPLRVAAERGNEAVLKMLLDKGASADLFLANGLTALMQAAESGHVGCIRVLLEKGDDINRTEFTGLTALMLAARAGKIAAVKALLAAGADLNMRCHARKSALDYAKDHPEIARFLEIEKLKPTVVKTVMTLNSEVNETPLMLAVSNADIKQIFVELVCGVSINAICHGKWSPLIIAAEKGHVDIIHILFELGADLNLANSEGWTPLMIAAANAKSEAVSALLTLGANIQGSVSSGHNTLMLAVKAGDLKATKVLIEHKAEVNAINSAGITALMLAIAADKPNLEIIKALLAAGAYVFVSARGKTGLDLAKEKGEAEVIKLLEAAEKEKKSKFVTKPEVIDKKWDETPLMCAVSRGDFKGIYEVLEKGGNVNCTSSDELTPLMIAAERDQVGAIKELVALGASVNASKKNGWTALMSATLKGNVKAITLLLELGAKIDQATIDGQTSLMVAAQYAQIAAIKVLLEKGANINKVKCDDSTVLMHAVFSQADPAPVEVLLDLGAPIFSVVKGKTALDLAREKNHTDIITLLEVKQAKAKFLKKRTRSEMNWDQIPLMLAAKKGDVKKMLEALEEGESINCISKEGWTALRIGISENNVEVMDLLAQSGADLKCELLDVDATEKTKETVAGKANQFVKALRIAEEVFKGREETISFTYVNDKERQENYFETAEKMEVVINHDGKQTVFSVVARDEGFYIQSHEDDLANEILFILLLKMAASSDPSNSINLPDIDNENNFKLICRIAAKAEVGISLVNLNQQVWLESLPESERPRITTFPAFHALNYAVCKGKVKLIDSLISRGAPIDIIDSYGQTPLSYAISHNQTESIRLLVQRKADVNEVVQDSTPLIHAAKIGSVEAIRELLISSAQIDAVNKHKSTALMFAAQEGHLEAVKALVEANAKLLLWNEYDMSALDYAREENHSEIVAFLEAVEKDKKSKFAKRSVHLKEKWEETPLMVASSAGDIKAIYLELERGVSINSVSSDGWTALLRAAEQGHVPAIHALLECGADVNQANDEVVTALMLAAQHGHTEATQELIKSGALVFVRSKSNKTALDFARNKSHVEVIKLLEAVEKDKKSRFVTKPEVIDKKWDEIPLIKVIVKGDVKGIYEILETGFSVNSKATDGMSVLMEASKYGHVPTIKVLLECGADVNQVNDDGETALMIAAREDHEEAIKVLLECGANLNKAASYGRTALMHAAIYGKVKSINALVTAGADVNRSSAFGATPLSCAACNDHVEAMNVLIALGARVDNLGAIFMAAEAGSVEAIKTLQAAGADVNNAAPNGKTAIMYAAEAGHSEVILVLEQLGADINQKAINGLTPLMIAVKNGKIEAAKKLIELGAEIDQTKLDGVTALMIAAENNNLEAIEALVELGKANVNYADEDGWTSLIYAVRKGHADAIKVLLASGAEVNKADSNGKTALMCVVRNTETVQLLLDAGADVTQTDCNGGTVLMFAAVVGNITAIELLVKHNSKLNSSDNDGVTPLMLAASAGEKCAVELLVSLGANIDLRDAEGQTALDHARLGGHSDIVAFLETHSLTDTRVLAGAGALPAVDVKTEEEKSRTARAFSEALATAEADETLEIECSFKAATVMSGAHEAGSAKQAVFNPASME